MKFDWNGCGRRTEIQLRSKDAKPPVKTEQILFDGNIYKLHGDMEHGSRKENFFGFDKSRGEKECQGAVLICTDVASRGLDFKNVAWILQYDLSSQPKEYVNRVGRTARIASQGSSLCLLMP